MDGGAVVLQILGLVVLLSWLLLAGAVAAARRGGMRDAESAFLGWLAQRDYQVWTDYIEFKHARDTSWQRED
jgi:hypothetical protein